jgi:hypothetical protein
MEKVIRMKFNSWKTTLGGIVSILTGLGMFGKILNDFGTGEQINLEQVGVAVGAISAGAGLLFARDNQVTSEQAGAGDSPVSKPPTPLGKFCLTLLVLGSAVFGLTAASCPSREKVDKAAEWGYDASARVRRSQNIALELYKGGVISLAAKDGYFDAAKTTFDVLEVYNDEAERQYAAIKAGTQTEVGAKAILHEIVRGKVFPAINTLIVKLNVMDPQKAGRLFSLIRTLASGFLTVLEVVDIKDVALTPLREVS